MRFDLSKTETLLICPTILTQDLFLMSHLCTNDWVCFQEIQLY